MGSIQEKGHEDNHHSREQDLVTLLHVESAFSRRGKSASGSGLHLPGNVQIANLLKTHWRTHCNIRLESEEKKRKVIRLERVSMEIYI